MRHLPGVVALVAALGCGSANNSVRRTLVTDNIAPRSERSSVRAWHLRHDWCERRKWDSTDEYQKCDPQPYMDQSARPMYSMFGYRDGRVQSIVLFIPVPCRMTGRCDHLLPTSTNLRDRPFVDFEHGLVGDLASEGQKAAPTTDYVPSMHRRLLDGLAVEFDTRYGKPVSRNGAETAMVWRSPEGEIVGLFLAPSGRWVVETHEFPVPVAAPAAITSK